MPSEPPHPDHAMMAQREPLPQGCCGCSDCNGPRSDGDCFWDAHKPEWKRLGVYEQWLGVTLGPPLSSALLSDSEFFSLNDCSDSDCPPTAQSGARTKAQVPDSGAAAVVSSKRKKKRNRSVSKLFGKAAVPTPADDHIRALSAEVQRLRLELAAADARSMKFARVVTVGSEWSPNGRPHQICATEWNGVGDPYLLYLSRVAHFAQPQAVAGMHRAVEAIPRVSRPVLIGAAAWTPYISTPLHTEDLDFVVDNVAADDLRNIAERAVAEMSKCTAVQRIVGEMNAVVSAYRATCRASMTIPLPADAIDSVRGAGIDAKAATEVECTQCFRLKPNGHQGWKLVIGHYTLLDVGPSWRGSQDGVDSYTDCISVSLSRLLPTAQHWTYSSPVDPLVLVANVTDLLEDTGRSLASGLFWRRAKDLPRLRFIAHEAAILTSSEDNMAHPLAKDSVAVLLYELQKKYMKSLSFESTVTRRFDLFRDDTAV